MGKRKSTANKNHTGGKVSKYSNLVAKRAVKKQARKSKKAAYIESLPKNPILRALARMHPKRVAGFWFSRKGLKIFLYTAGTIAVLIAIIIGALFLHYKKDLDAINPETLSQRVQSNVTKYYDRRGPDAGDKALLWEDKGDGNYKVVVKSKDISTYMKQATIAIEDKDFYKHGGISITGIIRAGLSNYFGKSTQGGSTLTQQLIKQVFFTTEEQQDRSLSGGISRKIKEAILSFEVERIYNKDQILTMYLNESPYGGRRNGVQSAAKSYFGVDASELNLAQAALLAAIPNQPGLLNPYNEGGQESLIARQHLVLDKMVQQKYITKDQADQAKSVKILDTILPETSQYEDIKAPHFVMMVRDQLTKELGAAVMGKGGLTVTTTLDSKIQNKLEKSFDEEFNPKNPNYQGVPERAGFNDGAATVEDTQTGQIVALMGSSNYNTPGFGQTNAAISYIQPGSTIKPLVYANLFSQKDDTMQNIYGSGTVLSDSYTVFPGDYKPKDADKRWLGNISIRYSLALSRNIPAIKAMQISGVQDTLDFIRKAGATSYCTEGPDRDVGLAAAIGGCGLRQIDHVHAYSTLARGGVYKPQATVLKVTDSKGKTLKEWKDDNSKKLIDPQVTYILADILSDDNARSGLYGRNFPGIVVDGGKVKTATKTGTSDVNGDAKDIWTVSYNPALTMAVWFGNPDPIPLKDGNSSLPAKIINDVMSYGAENVYAKEGKWKPGMWYKEPKGLIHIGKELYPSWYNKSAANLRKEMTFDRVSKKLATSCTPADAKIQQGVVATVDARTKKVTYSAFGGYDASKYDDKHHCNGGPGISITFPDDDHVTVSYTRGSDGGKIKSVTVTINGEKKQMSVSNGGSSQTYDISGSAKVSVVVTDDLYYNISKSATGGNTVQLPPDDD